MNQNEDNININSEKINNVDTYVGSNEEDWLKMDGKGWSKSSVLKYLFTTFTDYLKTIFLTQTHYDEIMDEVYYNRAMIIMGPDTPHVNLLLKAALLEATDTGETQYVDDWICPAHYTFCMKINNGGE